MGGDMFNRKVNIKDVVKSWSNFLNTYRKFRESNEMKEPSYSAFEICTSLSDKHGRICRQVKHAERGDHKFDWPAGMTEAMAGYIVYLEMLLTKYKLSASDGWVNELESALSQYKNKTKSDYCATDNFECGIIIDQK
jgi:hypothetical protein